MRRLVLSRIKVLSFFFILILPLIVSGHCLAQEISIPVELTEYGSYNIHVDQAGLNDIQAREAAHYVKGQLHFKGQPLLSALTVALSVSEPMRHLNLDELEDLCNQQLPTYAQTLDQSTPPFMKVETDGSIKSKGTACEYYDLKAFLQVFTSEQAAHGYNILNDEHKRLITAWRRGFQDAVSEESERFYEKFPELQPTQILEALQSLDNRQLASAITSWETVYDTSSLQNLSTGSAPFITEHKFGQNLSNGSNSSNEVEENRFEELDIDEEVKAQGASNSAAVIYKNSIDELQTSCMQTGQPHQPPTDLFKLVPYCIRYKNSLNETVPVLQVSYTNTLFYSPVSASKYIASGGTADPVLPYEMFYAKTNGRQYLDNTDGTWHNFRKTAFEVPRKSGTTETITRHSADGFGGANFIINDPNNTGLYAMLGRRRNADNAKAFFDEEKVAITGDAQLFENSLKRSSAKFWGKTYCGPDTQGGQKAAMINYQGRMHDMEGIEEFDPIFINPVEQKFLRGERVDNAYCNGVSWVSSDNGPLGSGASVEECPWAAQIPNAFDPGPPNARQRFVKEFAQKVNSQNGVATHQELLEFGTSTFSYPARKLALTTAFAVGVISQIPADSPLLQGAAVALANYDGVHRGNEMALFVYILYEEYQKRITPPSSIAPAIVNFISGMGDAASVHAAVQALDSQQAAIFHSILDSTVNKYFQNCYAKGITRYSDAVRVTYEGQTLIAPGSWNGPSPIGGARNVVTTSYDENLCSIEVKGLSPLSHIYLDQKYKVFQFGTSANKHSFISSDVHDRSVLAWADVLKKHNAQGQGHGGGDAHIELCSFDPNQPSGPQTQILEQFTIRVPSDLFSQAASAQAPTTIHTIEVNHKKAYKVDSYDDESKGGSERLLD